MQPAVRHVLASRQVASATWALQEVAAGLLTDHLCHCVLNAARASDAGGEAALTEVAHRGPARATPTTPWIGASLMPPSRSLITPRG